MVDILSIVSAKAKKFGFRESEAVIYFTLLMKDRVMSQRELKEETGLSTGMISEALKKLTEKELVSVRKQKGIKVYDAIPSFVSLFSTLIDKIMQEDVDKTIRLLKNIKSKKIQSLTKDYESVRNKSDIIRYVANASDNELQKLRRCLDEVK